jgi:hypothetical protein
MVTIAWPHPALRQNNYTVVVNLDPDPEGKRRPGERMADLMVVVKSNRHDINIVKSRGCSPTYG